MPPSFGSDDDFRQPSHPFTGGVASPTAPSAPAGPTDSTPHPFGGEIANGPSNFSQPRLNALNGDLTTKANQYGAGAFNDHWDSLTSGIDKNNNDAVEKFANQYGGVQRGQVGMNGQYHTMTNDELLAAAKSKYQPTFQRTLTGDPTYTSILNGTHSTVAGIVGQRLQQSPFQIGENAAAVQGAQNNAAAIPVYAQAAADTGAGNLQTGLGNYAKGQADLTDATGKANTLYPSVANLNNAQAGDITAKTPWVTGQIGANTNLTNAEAGDVTAMTPANVARENAETEQIPQFAQNGMTQAQARQQFQDSQTKLNNARAAAAGKPKTPPEPGTEEQATTPAAAPQSAPIAAAASTSWAANPDGTFSHPGYPAAKYQRVQGGYKLMQPPKPTVKQNGRP